MSEKLLTQKEFHKLTGVSRVRQWEARKSGTLGYYKINSRILYSEKQLQDFLKKFENPPRIDQIVNPENEPVTS
jgi:hypothetical protein